MKLFAILAAVQAHDEDLVSVFDTKCTNIGKFFNNSLTDNFTKIIH